MLAAGAARAVGVDAEVGVVDLDLGVVGEERARDDLGERGVAAVGLVERRQADEAVLASLGLEDPVGVLALDREGRGLEAGFLARARLETSVLKPRSAAQRRYMRRSISVKSCASVPPASDWIVTTASPRVVLAGEERVLLEAFELGLEWDRARSRSRRPCRRPWRGALARRRTRGAGARSARVASLDPRVLGGDPRLRPAGRSRSRARPSSPRARRSACLGRPGQR